MNQQELRASIMKSEEIRAKAMKMAEESNALLDTDFKRSMDMFLEAMDLWNKGAELQCRAFDEALDSGLMELSAEDEEKLSNLDSKQ